jgi:hypothetical protein
MSFFTQPGSSAAHRVRASARLMTAAPPEADATSGNGAPPVRAQQRTHAAQQTGSVGMRADRVDVGAGFKPAPTAHYARRRFLHRPASVPNDPRPRRRSLRLPGYDYSQTGAYFITACTHNRVMLFGELIDCDVRLSELGTIVQQTWDDLPTHYHGIDLDALIVMPNHVHGIIILADASERRSRHPGNRARFQDVLGARRQ